jgi:hypothetical protein
MVVTTIALDTELHRRLAVAALDDRAAMTVLIRQAVEEWLERRERKKKPRGMMGERGHGGVWRPTYQDHKTTEKRLSNIWWIWYPLRGKKKHESSHSPKRSDAVRLLRRRLGEMGTGRLIGSDIEKTTFKDLRSITLVHI